MTSPDNRSTLARLLAPGRFVPRSLFARITLAQGAILLAFLIAMPLIVSAVLRSTVDELIANRLAENAEWVARRLTVENGRLVIPAGTLADTVFGSTTADRAFAVFDSGGAITARSARLPQLPAHGKLPEGQVSHVGRLEVLVVRRTFRGIPATLLLEQDLANPDVVVDDIVGEFLERFLWTIPVALLAAFLAGGWAAQRTTREVARAAEVADRIDPHRLDQRIPDDVMPTELLPLVRAANRALGRLEQGFAEQSEFVADVAHELRTPLAVVSLRAQAVEDAKQRAAILAGIERARHVIDQLLELASIENRRPEFGSLDLAAIAEEAVIAQAPLVYAGGRTIELALDEPVPVTGNAALIGIVLTNLVGNAMRHTPPGSAILVRAGPGPELSVIDDGPGLAHAGFETLRQRWRRADTARSDGAGLGLAIVERIMKLHGGALEHVESARGAHFRLRFVAQDAG